MLPRVPSVLVDIAGDQRVRDTVHEVLRDDLRYSSHIGATHGAIAKGLPSYGPEPVFFFAPEHILERRKTWGSDELRSRLGTAWWSTCNDALSWLHIEHVADPANIELGYGYVLDGVLAPDRALIFDLKA